MAKKRRRRQREALYDTTGSAPTTEQVEQAEQAVAQVKAIAETPPAEQGPVNDPRGPVPVLSSELLASVRHASMRALSDAARNIAELEAWRNEIDATIAFLRAQRK